MRPIPLILSIAAMMFALGVQAQVDSVLTARYYKTPYDTDYVVRPEGSLTLKVKVNQSGDDIHAKGDKTGVSSKADLKTDFKTTVSIGASYRGISTALAFNPAKMIEMLKST